MRVVIQRVQKASVLKGGKEIGKIGKGLVVLAGFEENESEEDLNWMANKILQLRIFNDDQDVMNLPLTEVAGDLMVISQFTLHALTKKGNRPSYIRAARPEIALPYYNRFTALFEKAGQKV